MDMASVDIKYLMEDVDRHGNVRLYVRRNGHKKVRIRAEKGSPEFWDQYRTALGEPPKAEAPKESLRWLTIEYRKSAEFKNNLGERSRNIRARQLERFCQSVLGSDGKPAGVKPYKFLEARHIRKWRDENCEAPEGANNVLKALRGMFTWAVGAEKTDRNPAKDVPYLKGSPDGWHTWDVEEVEQFKERHPIGTKAHLALSLLLFTGVRRSDAVRLGRQMEKRKRLHFTEVKGRERTVKKRALPILPQLRQSIDACPSGHLTYLVTTFGKPFSSNGFGNWFKKRCREAGLPHCSAHGLRKAGATIAANNGATEAQLMAIFGWESMKQASTYTKKANRDKLVDDAMHLLVPRTESEEDEAREA